MPPSGPGCPARVIEAEIFSRSRSGSSDQKHQRPHRRAEGPTPAVRLHPGPGRCARHSFTV